MHRRNEHRLSQQEDNIRQRWRLLSIGLGSLLFCIAHLATAPLMIFGLFFGYTVYLLIVGPDLYIDWLRQAGDASEPIVWMPLF